MTPKHRARIERMVLPSWHKAGSPMRHNYVFQVYVYPRDLNPMAFPPSGTALSEQASTYYVARLDLNVRMHEDWRIRKLFASVSGTDIEVLLFEDRQ